MEAEAGDAAAVGFQRFEAPAAGMGDAFANGEHAAGEDEGEAAERVDILLDDREAGIDRLADLVEFDAGVGVEGGDRLSGPESRRYGKRTP